MNDEYYNGLHKLKVRPPNAYARSNRASQRIAWRLVVQAWDGDSWLVHKASSWLAKTATPSTPAAFSTRGLIVDSYHHHGEWSPYRARIELRWYAKDGSTVVGRARLFPHYYHSSEGDLPPWQQLDGCGGTTG